MTDATHHHRKAARLTLSGHYAKAAEILLRMERRERRDRQRVILVPAPQSATVTD